jgi:RNA polymerase sigma factor (sigma-70 family)
MIYTNSLRLTGSADTAEEIVQDCFLKVWLKRETLPEIQNFGGWLYTVAQNLTLDAIRKSKRNLKRVVDLDHAGHKQIESRAQRILEEKEYAQVLHQAIERLPAKQQQTYKLIREQGLKRNEVAALLNVSPETVKCNLDLAVRSVRAFCRTHLDLIGALIILEKFC